MKKKGTVEVMRRDREDEEEGSGAHKRRKMDELVAEKKVPSDIRVTIEEITLKMRNPTENTATLISVSHLLLLLLDKIGPMMTVLRNDVKQNIERLEDLFVSNPSLYSSVLEMLRKERDDGTARKSQSCSRSIVWLTRSIDFSMLLMENLMKDPELTLEQAVEEAYDTTLKPWHGWISSAAYKVALKLIPDRRSFINLLLDKEEDQNLFRKDIYNLFSLLQPLVAEMHSLLREFKLEMLKSN